jgi:adenine/guanine phosphoribosyltransferase-like PRPP-binding protein
VTLSIWRPITERKLPARKKRKLRERKAEYAEEAGTGREKLKAKAWRLKRGMEKVL